MALLAWHTAHLESGHCWARGKGNSDSDGDSDGDGERNVDSKGNTKGVH